METIRERVKQEIGAAARRAVRDGRGWCSDKESCDIHDMLERLMDVGSIPRRGRACTGPVLNTLSALVHEAVRGTRDALGIEPPRRDCRAGDSGRGRDART